MSHTPSQEELLQRELLQARLISSIFAEAAHQEVVLKGGFAMRAVMGSIRRTKDIDLAQNPEVSQRRLQGLMRRAIRSALATGLLQDVAISEPKQTETTARWKINGRTDSGSQVQLTIEAKRHPLPRDHVVQHPFEPPKASHSAPVLVETYDATALAAAKTLALTADNRSAVRDLYDLHVLITMSVTPPLDLLSGLEPAQLEAMAERLWTKIEALDYARFNTELAPYLPSEVSRAIDADTWETMRLNVGNHLESWFAELRAGGHSATMAYEDKPTEECAP